jgi:hypothetical protein
MGGLGHYEVFLAWEIPSPSYIKSSGLHTTIVQNATPGRTITSFNAYHKVTEWFLHHMNGLILFKRYNRSLDTLELNVFIAFSLLITIGEVCMFKSKTLMLGVNNMIE